MIIIFLQNILSIQLPLILFKLLIIIVPILFIITCPDVDFFADSEPKRNQSGRFRSEYPQI